MGWRYHFGNPDHINGTCVCNCVYLCVTVCVVALDFKETEKEMTHKVKVDLVSALFKIAV